MSTYQLGPQIALVFLCSKLIQGSRDQPLPSGNRDPLNWLVVQQMGDRWSLKSGKFFVDYQVGFTLCGIKSIELYATKFIAEALDCLEIDRRKTPSNAKEAE